MAITAGPIPVAGGIMGRAVASAATPGTMSATTAAAARTEIMADGKTAAMKAAATATANGIGGIGPPMKCLLGSVMKMRNAGGRWTNIAVAARKITAARTNASAR